MVVALMNLIIYVFVCSTALGEMHQERRLSTAALVTSSILFVLALTCFVVIRMFRTSKYSVDTYVVPLMLIANLSCTMYLQLTNESVGIISGVLMSYYFILTGYPFAWLVAFATIGIGIGTVVRFGVCSTSVVYACDNADWVDVGLFGSHLLLGAAFYFPIYELGVLILRYKKYPARNIDRFTDLTTLDALVFCPIFGVVAPPWGPGGGQEDPSLRYSVSAGTQHMRATGAPVPRLGRGSLRGSIHAPVPQPATSPHHGAPPGGPSGAAGASRAPGRPLSSSPVQSPHLSGGFLSPRRDAGGAPGVRPVGPSSPSSTGSAGSRGNGDSRGHRRQQQMEKAFSPKGAHGGPLLHEDVARHAQGAPRSSPTSALPSSPGSSPSCASPSRGGGAPCHSPSMGRGPLTRSPSRAGGPSRSPSRTGAPQAGAKGKMSSRPPSPRGSMGPHGVPGVPGIRRASHLRGLSYGSINSCSQTPVASPRHRPQLLLQQLQQQQQQQHQMRHMTREAHHSASPPLLWHTEQQQQEYQQQQQQEQQQQQQQQHELLQGMMHYHRRWFFQQLQHFRRTSRRQKREARGAAAATTATAAAQQASRAHQQASRAHGNSGSDCSSSSCSSRSRSSSSGKRAARIGRRSSSNSSSCSSRFAHDQQYSSGYSSSCGDTDCSSSRSGSSSSGSCSSNREASPRKRGRRRHGPRCDCRCHTDGLAAAAEPAADPPPVSIGMPENFAGVPSEGLPPGYQRVQSRLFFTAFLRSSRRSTVIDSGGPLGAPQGPPEEGGPHCCCQGICDVCAAHVNMRLPPFCTPQRQHLQQQQQDTGAPTPAWGPTAAAAAGSRSSSSCSCSSSSSAAAAAAAVRPCCEACAVIGCSGRGPRRRRRRRGPYRRSPSQLEPITIKESDAGSNTSSNLSSFLASSSSSSSEGDTEGKMGALRSKDGRPGPPCGPSCHRLLLGSLSEESLPSAPDGEGPPGAPSFHSICTLEVEWPPSPNGGAPGGGRGPRTLYNESAAHFWEPPEVEPQAGKAVRGAPSLRSRTLSSRRTVGHSATMGGAPRGPPLYGRGGAGAASGSSETVEGEHIPLADPLEKAQEAAAARRHERQQRRGQNQQPANNPARRAFHHLAEGLGAAGDVGVAGAKRVGHGLFGRRQTMEHRQARVLRYHLVQKAHERMPWWLARLVAWLDVALDNCRRRRKIMQKATWRAHVPMPVRNSFGLFSDEQIEQWYVQWLNAFNARYFARIAVPLILTTFYGVLSHGLIRIRGFVVDRDASINTLEVSIHPVHHAFQCRSISWTFRRPVHLKIVYGCGIYYISVYRYEVCSLCAERSAYRIAMRVCV